MKPHSDGGPAFPQTDGIYSTSSGGRLDPGYGMTMRDYFAAKAMQGLLAGALADGSALGENDAATLSVCAFRVADEMLKARQA